MSSADGPERRRETEVIKDDCFKPESEGSRALRIGKA